MTIAKPGSQSGIDVHFDPSECELFVKLALDAEKAGDEGPAAARRELSYLSISLALGQKIRALTER